MDLKCILFKFKYFILPEIMSRVDNRDVTLIGHISALSRIIQKIRLLETNNKVKQLELF